MLKSGPFFLCSLISLSLSQVSQGLGFDWYGTRKDSPDLRDLGMKTDEIIESLTRVEAAIGRLESRLGDDPSPTQLLTATCAVKPNPNYLGTESVEGIVYFSQIEGQSLEITVDLTGFAPPSEQELLDDADSLYHGFHVHEYGDITGGCETAGGHYNPFNMVHGGRNDTNRHVGDFGNIQVNTSAGTVFTMFQDSVASLFGTYSIIGRAIVVHANRDDEGMGGDPGSLVTGNAGPRMACCVIGIAPPQVP